MKISEIKEAGKYEIDCLITKCDMGKTNKSTPYLSMLLQDATGQIDAKFWNLTEEQVGQYKVGMIVHAKGDVIVYRNALQFRVQKMESLPDESLTDYVQQAPMTQAQMEDEINGYIASMQDETLKAVTSRILDQYKTDFYSYPAATKNHHTFVGGLAFHSISMTRLALQVCNYYPYLDRDLLIAGTLLHDIGKTMELSAAYLPSYTPKGNLLGHISIMHGVLSSLANEMGVAEEESVILLEHMILSHHGKMEFGSPVLPMIPEAEVLTTLDNLDARLYMMKQSIDQTMPGDFGPRVFSLENRMIYARKDKK